MMIALYILLGIVALFILLQMVPRFISASKKGKEAPELSGRYSKAVKKKDAALFYFYSPQCGACKPMTPMIDKLAKTYRNTLKVNVAEDMDTARKFGVMGTPSVVLVDQGKITEYLVGPQPEDKIRGLLKG
jgi:thioredoxin 1